MHILGEIKKADCKAVAVVGTRQITPRGRALTQKYVKALVGAGYVIVSGLARGVDTVAHQTALDCKGRTLAVLGSGLTNIYPPENKELAERISKHGAVISVFADDEKPYPKNFLARNRLIVSLSQAVLVIEGARRSGTLSTAAWAAQDGKEVFAVPGSEATDWLIGEGANAVKIPNELLGFLSTL